MTQAALSIQGIYKRYDQIEALKGIDLEISQGEFFGLLGPNGAGKSTLINSIAGLVRPDAGQIKIIGYDTIREFRQARCNIGVVPQELVYDPFFTVEDIIQLQAGYFGVRKMGPWFDELLAALELEDKRTSNMRQLSGGMKRRVLIAQALAHRPPIIILDEPTAGVDVDLRKGLWQFTRRLNGEGMTVVLTTHYLEEAEALCDRVAIMNHGTVVDLATMEALLQRDATRFMEVTFAHPLEYLPETLAPFTIEHATYKLLLNFSKEEHSPIELLNQIQGLGLNIVDLQVRQPTLEDIFLQMTGEKITSEPERASDVMTDAELG